jgi:hypothetical protein
LGPNCRAMNPFSRNAPREGGLALGILAALY